jgi:hypothetical protein
MAGEAGLSPSYGRLSIQFSIEAECNGKSWLGRAGIGVILQPPFILTLGMIPNRNFRTEIL